jgi:hypothetical protein
MPGRLEDGTVDGEELHRWTLLARELAVVCDRREIGDFHIGRIFAFSPPDPDGTWPHLAVRDLIEELASPEIEQGWRNQIFNNRGVTSRLPVDGGEQERALAEHFEGHAKKIVDMWPRTAAVLRELAEDYRRWGKQEDQGAELTQDFWR